MQDIHAMHGVPRHWKYANSSLSWYPRTTMTLSASPDLAGLLFKTQQCKHCSPNLPCI